MGNLRADPGIRQFVDVDPNSEPSRQAYVKFVEGKSPDEVRYVSGNGPAEIWVKRVTEDDVTIALLSVCQVCQIS